MYRRLELSSASKLEFACVAYACTYVRTTVHLFLLQFASFFARLGSAQNRVSQMPLLGLFLLLFSPACAFVPQLTGQHRYHPPARCPSSSSRLHLIPLSDFGNQCTFLSSSSQAYRTCFDESGSIQVDEGTVPYVLGIAEEDDLPDIARLTIDAFGDVAITLGGDLNGFERLLLTPGVALFNGYTGYAAYTEVLSGLRSRMKDKLENVDLASPLAAKDDVGDMTEEDSAQLAANSSLILALGRPKPEGESGTIEAIATVELRLQPTDAKIPFSQPWVDSLERRAAKALGVDGPARDDTLQPYLSNLCVAESARGRRIGKALVRCLERIASDTWGYERIYLHVDLENAAAYNLYKSEGYEDVGFRWDVPWAGGASDIGYFVKKLQ